MNADSNEERDPDLLALFAAGAQELPDDGFVMGVSAAIDRARRLRRLRSVVLAALILLLELLLNAPLTRGVGGLADALETTLVPVDSLWLQFFLSPVNSLAGLVGLSLLGLHIVYRKILR